MSGRNLILQCEACGEIRDFGDNCAACNHTDGRAVDPEGLFPVSVCARCCAGYGGECHTPGCAFWMHDAPTERIVPMSNE